MTADIAALRHIWQQAFGDPDAVLDVFFATGFSPDRCHFLREDGAIVSALYWFDCALNGHNLAYIYAVATEKNHRGKGLAHRLMDQTHGILREKGYAGAVLVPGSQELFSLYGLMGYRTVTAIREFSARWGDTSARLQEIDAARYAQLRKTYLPAGGVVQEGAALDFLHTQTGFFAGEDFMLAATVQGETLLAQELLGNARTAPEILRTFGTPQGQFRTPGAGRDFAMLFPLRPDCPVPSYFGLALD